MKKIYLLLLVTLVLSFVSCNQATDNETEINEQVVNEETNNEEIELNESENTEEETNGDTEEQATIVDEETKDEPVEAVEETTEVVAEEAVEEIDMNVIYKEHSVNELGQLIVIMYHNLAEKPGAYATTKELFIKDLERLYNEGYRTVSMTDLVTNNIDIPIGTSPVVLTFDDASISNFGYGENGEISKDSVVSILDEFSKTHEGFGSNAIFYVFGENPFRQIDKLQEKLDYLIANGYEVGNHTEGHNDLSKLGAEGIQRALGENEMFIDQYLPEHDMVHLSLPYGHRPSEALQPYLFSGAYEGVSYEIMSAVNVGWNPIKSPAHTKFNPKSINRVTVGDDKFELDYWLDYFLENPNKKYISDGDSFTIVIPEEQLENVNEMYLGKVIIYSDSEAE